VATVRIADGTYVYLGLSERDELRVLRSLRVRFLALWFVIVLLGFVIVFYATRRMLGHVRDITEAASGIGQADLSSRVPTTSRNDEVGHLARTLNHMLDRIESAMNQLHTITDSLAHDLRSPLTAVRGKLEVVLSGDVRPEQVDPIVSAIDELDRLTEFLNTSLDVAEAKADALRMSPTEINIDELLRVMIDLYEPCLSEKGISVQLRSTGTVNVMADAALLHRVIANLLDNEAKHLSASCTVVLGLRSEDGFAELVVEDNGPGFDEGIETRIFEQRAKGRDSKGHGLGLAFVAAVVRAHGGDVAAENLPEGGARMTLTLPLVREKRVEAPTSLALMSG
jgi:signal transduction histidine kinase